MNLYLDTEFNGFGGELISMALVAEDDFEWYEVFEIKAPVNEWVKENVMPHLNKTPMPLEKAKISLVEFLNNWSEIKIIVDWPDDIKYFCEFLITAPGEMLPIKSLSFEMVRGFEYDSLIPHNALSDARAIKRSLTFRRR